MTYNLSSTQLIPWSMPSMMVLMNSWRWRRLVTRTLTVYNYLIIVFHFRPLPDGWPPLPLSLMPISSLAVSSKCFFDSFPKRRNCWLIFLFSQLIRPNFLAFHKLPITLRIDRRTCGSELILLSIYNNFKNKTNSIKSYVCIRKMRHALFEIVYHALVHWYLILPKCKKYYLS